jgi:XTP/dITP diphosphohydrolase
MTINRMQLATSNTGKLREYQRLAPASAVALELMPGFADVAVFEETAGTFAENAAGKALYYSQFTDGFVLSDDSGICVDALGGTPGVRSARYGGPQANDTDRNLKLLREMRGKTDRAARFVCVTALAHRGRAIAIVSDFAAGSITEKIHGVGGFGYDPVFFVPELERTFAEASPEDKDRLSHRGKAFRKMLAAIAEDNHSTFKARSAQ